MESIPVEMRMMIMEHLSNAQLLVLSLVNKLFNSEARSFMRDRANVTAVLKSPYREIVPFAADLNKMNVVPFTGIIIQLCPEPHHPQLFKQSLPKNETLDSSFHAILNLLPLKRLQVTLPGFLDLTFNCPASLLVKKILHCSYCGVLEELVLADNVSFLQWIQEVVQDCTFPQLKILKLESDGDGRKTLKNFIKQMVARAPNLKEVHQEKEMECSENVLEESSAVLVSDFKFQPLIDELSASVAAVVRLRRMALQYHWEQSYRHLRVERFNVTIPMMLQLSLTTLNSLYVDLVLAVPLMSYGIRLENVTNLTIYISNPKFKFIPSRVLALVKRFDFTQIVPTLDKVVIEHALINPHFQEERMSEFIEQGIASAVEEPQPDRAVNIKHLVFRESFTKRAVPYFAEMFPNIEKLELLSVKGKKAPYPLIWENWPDLQELKVRQYFGTQDNTWNENLDSDFCGIFPQEVAHLREQDDEYLKAVNIVPVMPSLTCLKALRTLNIYYKDTGLGFPYKQKIIMTNPTAFIFSKVTGLTAFQRYPNLSVKIGTNSPEIYKAVGNMRPYASVGFPRSKRYGCGMNA